jgi:benzoate membrane transport protein
MQACGILALTEGNTNSMMSVLFSQRALPAWTAGLIAVLVGFTSSVAVVFQAAQAAGASAAQTDSWIAALCLAMGTLTIGLSWHYKQPVKVAWSTPGAALLAVSLVGVPLPKAIGAFVICGLLIFFCGISRLFERIMGRISVPLASGLLAGVLARFALDAFAAARLQPVLVLSMFVTYLLAKKVQPSYAALWVLLSGTLCALLQGQISLHAVSLSWTQVHWVTPEFDLGVAVSVAVPLFIVTMASQNVPGIATLRAHGYSVPVSPIISWTGLATSLLAPFGCYAVNLAAITAALCMGKDIHADPRQRYPAAMVAGLFYILIAFGAGSLASLLAALPKALILAVAGFALLTTIGNSLVAALSNEQHRDPALVTFLVTLSGLSFFNIGPAFWGLCAGTVALVVVTWRRASRR